MSPLPRQGWLFLIEFLNGISRNTSKCELGGFLLSQSHMHIASVTAVDTYFYYFW